MAKKNPAETHAVEIPSITYTPEAFIVRGRPVLIYSGAFHYFRCPKPLWEDRFIKIKRAGFNTVETYVPWNWHEKEEGKCDLSDLDDWITMAEKAGFFVILRPGPYICAEWDGGGFPGWLAGRDIRWRSDSRACLNWSMHWYELVMPVIAKHQITKGGRVIMVQLENEYEYSPEDDSAKRNYLGFLADAARRLGIDVPLVTCRTPVVWDRTNPEMKRLIDSWTFYPWWDFKPVEDSIAALRKAQNDAPLMILELQGGWYSETGGRVPRHTELSGAQIDALSKTVLSRGVTALNYYMLYGGTHPGYWGMPSATTSYDYAAPLAEPGGIWEKWDSVKLLGDFLSSFGETLATTKEIEGAHADHEQVRVVLRSGKSGAFLFVRNDTDDDQNVRITMPADYFKSSLLVKLAPRQAKILPVGVSAGRLGIEWCSAQIQSLHRIGNKWLLNLADHPGTYELVVNIQNRTIASTVYWDSTGRLSQVHSRLTVWGQSPRKAARTFTIDSSKGPVVVSTDSCFVPRWSEEGGILKTEIQSPPGTVTIRTLAFSRGSALKEIGTVTPEIPAGRIDLTDFQVTREEPAAGDGWRACKLEPLHELNHHDKGFVRYRAVFTRSGHQGLRVKTYAEDSPSVILNGSFVKDTNGSRSDLSLGLEGIAREGENTLEIICENRGRTKFGPRMEEPKGLAAVEMLAWWRPEIRLESWRIAGSEKPVDTPPQAAPEFDDSSWEPVTLSGGPVKSIEEFKGFVWYRSSFDLAEDDLRRARLNLRFEAGRGNPLVFLNGSPLARQGGSEGPLFAAGESAKPGRNVLAVCIEKRGLFGGIWNPVIVAFETEGSPIEGWEFLPGLSLLSPDSKPAEGAPWTLGSPIPERVEAAPAVCYRSVFGIPAPEGWVIPWKLELECKGDAVIILNGEHIGNFSPLGPQTEFYLPICFLKTAGEENELMLVVRNGKAGTALTKAAVSPYAEYSVFRHIMETAV